MDERENAAGQLLQCAVEDIFDGPSKTWFNLIYNQELRNVEFLKKLQKLTDKFNEREIVKKQLISKLKALKEQAGVASNYNISNVQIENGESSSTSAMKLFKCPECQYKTTRKDSVKSHIKAVHRKLRPWKCPNCDKGWFDISNKFKYVFVFMICYLF